MAEAPLSYLITHYYTKPANYDPNPFSQQTTKPYQFQKGAYKKPYNANSNSEDKGFSRNQQVRETQSLKQESETLSYPERQQHQ